MEMSRFFSQEISNLLNGATFAELDAAERRLLLTGYQAGLLVTMTPEARRIVALLDEQASVIRREANK